MSKAGSCYKVCINKQLLLNGTLLEQIQKIIEELKIKSSTGRPPLDFERGINGIFYLLKTGTLWKAIPNCFGSSSALHRLFQKLRKAGFFEKLWHAELKEYDLKHGLNLSMQAGDCAHIRSPLGQEKTGHSPVDRRKLGTKRSIIVDKNGIVIGCALEGGNRHDSILFEETLRSIPLFLNHPFYKEMHLDSAYDMERIKTALFNYYYVAKINPNPRNSKSSPRAPFRSPDRWIVESTHSWINRFRRLLIRYEKIAENYLALMHFSFAIITFKKI